MNYSLEKEEEEEEEVVNVVGWVFKLDKCLNFKWVT